MEKNKKLRSNNKESLNLITPTEWYNYYDKLTNINDENYEEHYTKQHAIISKELKQLLKTAKQNTPTELDKHFTQKEVEQGIFKLKKNKAAGSDSINNEMLKSAMNCISPLLTELFNKIILSEYYPKLWEVGLITPLHKGDDISNPDNYRGITINSCLSKLFNQLMNERLTKYMDDNDLIQCNQIGFRKDYRTSDHVFVMKTLIDNYLNKNKRLYMCFIDFKKAFDTVWRDGLFYKLLKKGLTHKFVNLLINTYSKQKSCVNLKQSITNTFHSTKGLKQGCNLSPNLFNLFIDDIIKCFNNKCDPAKLISKNINCLLYADDLVLISESTEGLQNCLNKLYDYIQTWKLSINYKKTKSITISKRKTKTKCTFTIGKEKVDPCNSYKYLGTTISENGSFKGNLVNLNKKAFGAMFSLLKCINKHYAGNIKILLNLFDRMIVPILLYNSEVWGGIILPKNLKQLDYLNENNINNTVEKLQNRFLKYILGVNVKSTNWAVRSETGRIPLTLKVYEAIIKYYQHIYRSKSKFMQESLKVNIDLDQNGINTWYTVLKRISQFMLLDIKTIRENKNISKLIKDKTYHLYKNTWNEEINKQKSNGKHQIYAEIKTQNCFEKYLDIENMNIRKAITKMRISSHKFPIETGRYEGKERHERLCPLCCNDIGNEKHYLFECSNNTIKKTRDEFLSIIYKKSPQIKRLVVEDQLKYFLLCRDETLIKDIGILFLKIQKEFENLF